MDSSDFHRNDFNASVAQLAAMIVNSSRTAMRYARLGVSGVRAIGTLLNPGAWGRQHLFSHLLSGSFGPGQV